MKALGFTITELLTYSIDFLSKDRSYLFQPSVLKERMEGWKPVVPYISLLSTLEIPHSKTIEVAKYLKAFIILAGDPE